MSHHNIWRVLTVLAVVLRMSVGWASAASVGTYVVFHETAYTLPAGRYSAGAFARPTRQTISPSRNQALFTDTGEGLVLGLGVLDRLELRSNLHWMTVSGSGHSGQFDLAGAGKYRLLSTRAAVLAAALGIGATKVMGHTAWYYLVARFPLTVQLAGLELSISPKAVTGFENESKLAAGIESALRVPFLPWLGPAWLDLVFEHLVGFDKPNPRFESFHFGKGTGYWAGIALKPTARVAIPVLFAIRPPRGQLAYGVAAVAFQYRSE